MTYIAKLTLMLVVFTILCVAFCYQMSGPDDTNVQVQATK